MEIIKIQKLNEVYLKISCERSIAMEMQDYFSFYVPGYTFMPSYKSKMWDGKIRLFNVNDNTIYFGLLKKVIEFCKDRDYKVLIDKDLQDIPNITDNDISNFLYSLKLKMNPRDYQITALKEAVNKNRLLLVSPTGSGKSYIIYLLAIYYNLPTLIIVPTTSLVHQLYNDFEDYGLDVENYVYKIHGGVDKKFNKPIVISTWQSLHKLPKNFFNRFKLVLGDECHLFTAKSLVSIMTKLENCKYRFGFTGTLDGTNTNKNVLEGLFGPVYKVTSTSELIEKKQLSNFKIKCLVLNYPDSLKKEVSKKTYQEEMNFLVSYEPRNNFICNLAKSLKGNTLILFQYVEKHGNILYDMLKNFDKKVYYIHGKIDGEERDEIRKIIEIEENAIIIASFATTSTGVNMKRLHNIIFASPSKSKIRNLQSIGRGLRLSEYKEEAVLFDISDDLKWKSKTNHTLNHFSERIKIYSEEKFDFNIFNIKI